MVTQWVALLLRKSRVPGSNWSSRVSHCPFYKLLYHASCVCSFAQPVCWWVSTEASEAESPFTLLQHCDRRRYYKPNQYILTKPVGCLIRWEIDSNSYGKVVHVALNVVSLTVGASCCSVLWNSHQTGWTGHFWKNLHLSIWAPWLEEVSDLQSFREVIVQSCGASSH